MHALSIKKYGNCNSYFVSILTSTASQMFTQLVLYLRQYNSKVLRYLTLVYILCDLI